MATTDSTLLAIASAGPIDSYADVSSRLQALQEELDAGDGLAGFNRLYVTMTRATIEAARKHRFTDPLFVERLDCHCASLYFVALAAHLSDPGSGPAAWEPLFQARGRKGILPIQYALAGANAQFNRDLPVALVTTFLELDRAPARAEPAHADYSHGSQILESVLTEARNWLLDGLLDELDSALGEVNDMLDMWSMRRAREAAWVASEVRWALRATPVVSRHHLEALDRMVGLASRALLQRSLSSLSAASPTTPPAARRASVPPSR
jgi:hypothetical protein